MYLWPVLKWVCRSFRTPFPVETTEQRVPPCVGRVSISLSRAQMGVSFFQDPVPCANHRTKGSPGCGKGKSLACAQMGVSFFQDPVPCENNRTKGSPVCGKGKYIFGLCSNGCRSFRTPFSVETTKQRVPPFVARVSISLACAQMGVSLFQDPVPCANHRTKGSPGCGKGKYIFGLCSNGCVVLSGPRCLCKPQNKGFPRMWER